MNILLIGGTGAIGTPLIDILYERGDNVYITTRKYRKSSNRKTFIQCDGHNDKEIESLMQLCAWDVVIDFLVYSSLSFSSHVELIIHKTKQYIFISSARVFEESLLPLNEDSPRLLDVCKDKEYLSTDEYALRKARCEDILKKYNNYTIVRPSITFNEHRLQLGVYEIDNWLSRILYGMPIVLSRDIMSKTTTMTYSNDVAKAIAGLSGNDKALRESFNITTSESLSWGDVVDVYLETLKERKITSQIIYNEHTLNLKIPSLKYQVLYARLFNRSFDNRKICSLLPDLKFSDVKTELKRCLNHNIQYGDHNIVLSVTNILQDRASGYVIKRKFIGSTIRYTKYLMARFFPEIIVINKLS